MIRGGQRKGAGRKSTWVSGAKFEDTVLIRVPKNIRDAVLEIAHKLDAGENIDLDSNSKIQDLQLRLYDLELANKLLIEQIEKYKLDLETQSNKIDNLERKEIVTNSISIDNELDTKSKKSTQLGLLDLENNFKIRSLTSIELSRRFKEDDAFVKIKKSYYKDRPNIFFDLLKELDPDGISWVTVGEKTKLRYVPDDKTSPEKLQALKNWIDSQNNAY
ncbi:hypothetical protein [Anabaena azotica]|uniref:hypothetical protein n=1 Tax=Anabaena azotica TaxID=197653 RepID=UPI0039A736EA